MNRGIVLRAGRVFILSRGIARKWPLGTVILSARRIAEILHGIQNEFKHLKTQLLRLIRCAS
jgi:hypothetical protein